MFCMRCYNCGNVLSENDFCTSCGVDVKEYKKIVRMSNTYYNSALMKAKQRDLSGAVDLLRRSVKFNKHNIKARNLLGLVYFEMGEVVQAMAEWVISKNIMPEKNLADTYLNTLQSNPNKLDTINQTIKKFNIALGYAEQGSYDLAVIQLKKVLNVNPNLVKGHQLLALLYMHNNQYEKAKRAIKKALKVDANNPLSKMYQREIEEVLDKTTNILTPPEEKNAGGKEQLSGFDVIIPHNSYNDASKASTTVVNILIGLVIGAAAAFFLITPTKVKRVTADHNAEMKQLNAKYDEVVADAEDKQRQIDSLNGEKSDIESQLKDANNANDAVLDAYDNVLKALDEYNKGDYIKCAEALSTIDEENSLSETFNNMYKTLKEESFTKAAENAYSSASVKYFAANSRDKWLEAIDELNLVFVYDYEKINYLDAADKLCNAYIKLYDCTVVEKPESAEKCKKGGITAITKLIENLSKIETVTDTDLEKYRNYLADLTARKIEE